jgi:hypothetical protein
MKKENKDSESKIIHRSEFLKRAGLALSGGALGSLTPFTASTESEKNYKNKHGQSEILYSDTENFSYWESILFRCFQGIVNRENAKVYLNRYEKQIFLDWYKQYDHLNFTKVDDPYQLLHQFAAEHCDGYVIMDKQIPDSTNIAANYASIENLIPVTEDLLSEGKLPDLNVIYDLRNSFEGVRFSNMDRIDIYRWVYENQWPEANHNLISIVSGARYNNGELETNFYTSNSSRDYAVAERALFFDLSSNPNHQQDYELKDQILSEMGPHEIVWGWHVDRDSEHQHIGQLSKHGKIAVGGANLAPNFSFHSRVKVNKAVENFRKRNKQINISSSVDEKIYLTFAMSDGDSINHLLRNAHGSQWLSEDRGAIPFNWEMQLKLTELGPAILDYFQATAKDNDHFIASASGIGYSFPSSMPTDKLKSLLYATKPYLRKTGMDSMVVLNSYQSVSEEKMKAYNEALGDDITGVMQGYTRAPGAEYLYGNFNESDSPGEYLTWLSTSLPVAHTDTIDDLENNLNLLAERRPQRPLFVPIHTPRSYFRYSDLVDLVNRLDSNTFEAVDGSSFNAKFANTHSNQVGVNLPEFFIPEPMTLNNGRLNKIFVWLQNFSEETSETKLQARLISDAWNGTKTSTELVKLAPKEKTEIGLNFGLRNQKIKGNGQIEYLIDGEPQIRVPVTFNNPDQ